MTTAETLIEDSRIPGKRDINYESLMNDLHNGTRVESECTDLVWDFPDGSKLRHDYREVHVYGRMPNTNTVGWYLAGWLI